MAVKCSLAQIRADSWCKYIWQLTTDQGQPKAPLAMLILLRGYLQQVIKLSLFFPIRLLFRLALMHVDFYLPLSRVAAPNLADLPRCSILNFGLPSPADQRLVRLVHARGAEVRHMLEGHLAVLLRPFNNGLLSWRSLWVWWSSEAGFARRACKVGAEVVISKLGHLLDRRRHLGGKIVCVLSRIMLRSSWRRNLGFVQGRTIQ